MKENKTSRRQSIFRGRILDLGLETVELPNGETAELEIVRHPGGAAAVALDDAAQVCLLRQFRHAAGGWLWELPAGKIEPGEDPFDTARREIAEEAGVAADAWANLGILYSSPGVLTEVIHLFLGRVLRHVGHEHEAHEVIEIHWLPLDKALQWCADGTITDAKTLVGLFRTAALIEGETQAGAGGLAP